jgi:NADH-quinone oxidoreductase subunit E
MEAAARPAPDSVRLPDFSEILSLNPMLSHPAAAMAAATAIGFGIANQMAGAFFGALQGAMETANRLKVTDEVEAVAADIRAVAEELEKRAAAKLTDIAMAAPATDTGIAKTKPVRKAAAPVTPATTRKRAVKTAATAVVEKAPKAKTKAVRAKPVSGDLKLISGIGPKLEEVLKGKGVTGLAQVAAWTESDIARLEGELGFDGRITRDDWVGQAKALLK